MVYLIRMRSNTLKLRAGAWTSVFSIPLVAAGYCAGHFGPLWLMAAGCWVGFVACLVCSLSSAP